MSSEDVKAASQEALREDEKNGFQKLYECWQKYIVVQGDYFEGGFDDVNYSG